jgi:hypothetical protein
MGGWAGLHVKAIDNPGEHALAGEHTLRHVGGNLPATCGVDIKVDIGVDIEMDVHTGA